MASNWALWRRSFLARRTLGLGGAPGAACSPLGGCAWSRNRPSGGDRSRSGVHSTSKAWGAPRVRPRHWLGGPFPPLVVIFFEFPFCFWRSLDFQRPMCSLSLLCFVWLLVCPVCPGFVAFWAPHRPGPAGCRLCFLHPLWVCIWFLSHLTSGRSSQYE